MHPEDNNIEYVPLIIIIILITIVYFVFIR